MKDINICNSVDISKQKEQQEVLIDKDVAGKNKSSESVNPTTNKRKVEAAIVTPEKKT